MSYYIGLMSGSSINAIDAVICEFSARSVRLLATHSILVPETIKQEIRGLIDPGFNEIDRLCQLDRKIGKLFAEAALGLLKKSGISSKNILAIGSHGQTIRHAPRGEHGYTLQIGDPNTIAAETGITTIADFRRRDVALGGQGAPLACGFHRFLLGNTHENSVVLNIGGIANITLVNKDPTLPLIGFDTGPGNTFLDQTAKKYFNRDYDEGGNLAKAGSVNKTLLEALLEDPYFSMDPPKSTSTDYFNANWLAKKNALTIVGEDLLATLTEFTCISITRAINQFFPDAKKIWLCGGGTYNHFLISRLQEMNILRTIADSSLLNIPPEWIESVAFAWLAKQTLEKQPSNCPSVTGAKSASLLGGIFI